MGRTIGCRREIKGGRPHRASRKSKAGSACRGGRLLDRDGMDGRVGTAGHGERAEGGDEDQGRGRNRSCSRPQATSGGRKFTGRASLLSTAADGLGGVTSRSRLFAANVASPRRALDASPHIGIPGARPFSGHGPSRPSWSGPLSAPPPRALIVNAGEWRREHHQERRVGFPFGFPSNVFGRPLLRWFSPLP